MSSEPTRDRAIHGGDEDTASDTEVFLRAEVERLRDAIQTALDWAEKGYPHTAIGGLQAAVFETNPPNKVTNGAT